MSPKYTQFFCNPSFKWTLPLLVTDKQKCWEPFWGQSAKVHYCQSALSWIWMCVFKLTVKFPLILPYIRVHVHYSQYLQMSLCSIGFYCQSSANDEASVHQIIVFPWFVSFLIRDFFSISFEMNQSITVWPEKISKCL